MKANFVRLVAFAVLLVLLEQFSDHYAKAFLNVSWVAIAVGEGIFLASFGAVAFRLYRGKGWARFGFTVAIPVVANSARELITGSDPAYPFLLLALAVPYAVAFGVGAGLMAIVTKGGEQEGRDRSA